MLAPNHEVFFFFFLRNYGASALGFPVKHVCQSKQSMVFRASTWQVVNIKEEEGKYGLDLRILVFEYVSHL